MKTRQPGQPMLNTELNNVMKTFNLTNDMLASEFGYKPSYIKRCRGNGHPYSTVGIPQPLANKVRTHIKTLTSTNKQPTVGRGKEDSVTLMSGNFKVVGNPEQIARVIRNLK